HGLAFYDQPHLSRSLMRYIGRTAPQLSQDGQERPLSTLYSPPELAGRECAGGARRVLVPAGEPLRAEHGGDRRLVGPWSHSFTRPTNRYHRGYERGRLGDVRGARGGRALAARRSRRHRGRRRPRRVPRGPGQLPHRASHGRVDAPGPGRRRRRRPGGAHLGGGVDRALPRRGQGHHLAAPDRQAPRHRSSPPAAQRHRPRRERAARPADQLDGRLPCGTSHRSGAAAGEVPGPADPAGSRAAAGRRGRRPSGPARGHGESTAQPRPGEAREDPRGARLMQRIGRYEVVDHLGAGSFATVHRARDLRLDDEVALKVLAENHTLNPDMLERFIGEGRALRRARSPHVAAVHDIGELPDNQPYLVLELADRGTLGQRVESLREQGWTASPQDLLVVARSLAAALGAVHRAQLVHRDLSPGNVLLTSQPDGNTAGHARSSGVAAAGGGPVPGGGALIAEDERLLLADLGLCKDLARRSGLTVAAGTSGFRAP